MWRVAGGKICLWVIVELRCCGSSRYNRPCHSVCFVSRQKVDSSVIVAGRIKDH